MCGIAGIIGPNTDISIAPMERMLAALTHRGPDDQSILTRPSATLGHTRLAIVDIEGGHQPMSSATGTSHLVFNGEIYGYKSLRERLADYPYRSASDSEVILAAYQRFGTDMANHLPGMFAFAIWDQEKRQLFCARDRFGEKPFYYACPSDGVIVFASELKAIVASGLVEPEVDRSALAYYFQHHFIHPWRTIYKNINVLPPGHTLVWKENAIHQERYWVPPNVQSTLNLNDATEQFRELLNNAVRSQLVADVEVGAFLSGGLDSTTIVALAADHSVALRTFCVNFGAGASEASYAKLAADQYGTRHVELNISDDALQNTLLDLSYFYDEPSGDSSNVPTYLIAREARKHVKVVLTGDGGDEMLGGYSWYRPLCWAEQYDSPSYWTWMTGRIVARASRALDLPAFQRLEQRNIGIGMSWRDKSVLESHRKQMTSCPDDELRKLGFGDCLPEVLSWDEPLLVGEGVAAAMSFDVQSYMAGDILTKIDRASMAHGLELRAPFLDRAVGEFCLSLPSTLRVTKNEDKRILRAAFAERWPEPIRSRSKQGFGGPVPEWLGRPAIRELVNDLVFSRNSPIYSLIDFTAARDFFQRSSSGHRWGFLILALWADRWLNQSRSVNP